MKLRKVLLVGSLLASGNAVSIKEQGSQLDETVSVGCHKACTQLSTTFGSAFHYPDNDQNFTIWDAKQQEVRPACRVEPSSANDVSRVLNILVDHWCNFAVKGGGHSRHRDDSNSVAGVTIDLERINTVEVSTDGTTARIGGGATTAKVFHDLDSHGLSFVGGRVGAVGVGGFTLGGGTSPFSNKYGLSLDNVFEYEVVLANGTISTVTQDNHPDLYFALRGGGNNFGIVTAFTVRTFIQGPVFTASTSYADNQTEQVLDQVYNLWAGDLASDVEMAYDMYYGYSLQTDQFTLRGNQRYAKPIMNPPVFSKIDEITPLTRSPGIATMGNMTGSPEPMGVTRNLFATLSVRPSRPFLTQALKIFSEEVREIKTVQGLTPNFISYPIQKNAVAAMKQRGGNALGIDTDGPLFLILLSTAWTDASGDAAVNKMTENTARRVNAAAEKLGVADRYRYINYASKAQADEVFPGYGKTNMQRLKQIQKAVDPKGIFTSKGLWRGFRKLL
ncbi:hypothetical protein VN97_g10083 [Penicillium thymicola]|uniref:FAD-binding PCMH-type domain-containing protein n=1 Tax=Penicillium thymicola TaxID=293382 RepID=A0AAI9T9N2_PENTH|nr:hypothetical protein VN97_g10083 [Penicillium thymicola]